MAFKEGDKKPVGSGRKKGQPNKPTIQLSEIAERLGVNPFEVLLLFSGRDHTSLGLPEFKERLTKTGEKVLEPTISPEIQVTAASKACEYLFPKRKAIEHSFDPRTATDDELIEQTRKLLDEIRAGSEGDHES